MIGSNSSILKTSLLSSNEEEQIKQYNDVHAIVSPKLPDNNSNNTTPNNSTSFNSSGTGTTRGSSFFSIKSASIDGTNLRDSDCLDLPSVPQSSLFTLTLGFNPHPNTTDDAFNRTGSNYGYYDSNPATSHAAEDNANNGNIRTIIIQNNTMKRVNS